MNDQWNIYILGCVDGSYYTWITNDLEKRLHMHNTGSGAKYTKWRTPVKCLWSQEVWDKSQASRYEYYIKKLSRKQKEQIIWGLLDPQTILWKKTS